MVSFAARVSVYEALALELKIRLMTSPIPGGGGAVSQPLMSFTMSSINQEIAVSRPDRLVLSSGVTGSGLSRVAGDAPLIALLRGGLLPDLPYGS